MTKDIRWKQRFENFENAFRFLKSATERDSFDDLQAAGLIHSFEFTFELAWKTMKDYLQLMGTVTQSPREAIKQAFASAIIEDGHLWIEMLDQRNVLTHTYSKEQAKKSVETICHRYFVGIEQVYKKLKSLNQ